MTCQRFHAFDVAMYMKPVLASYEYYVNLRKPLLDFARLYYCQHVLIFYLVCVLEFPLRKQVVNSCIYLINKRDKWPIRKICMSRSPISLNLVMSPPWKYWDIYNSWRNVWLGIYPLINFVAALIFTVIAKNLLCRLNCYFFWSFRTKKYFDDLIYMR